MEKSKYRIVGPVFQHNIGDIIELTEHEYNSIREYVKPIPKVEKPKPAFVSKPVPVVKPGK